MCDTPFKTPRSIYRTPKRFETPQSSTTTTASNESMSSNGSDNSDHLSMQVEFDDLCRQYRYLKDDKIYLESVLLEMFEQMKVFLQRQQHTEDELKRLRELLENKQQECCDLDNKLKIARKLIDKEKTVMRNKLDTLRQQRDDLVIQLSQVRDVIFRDNCGNNQRLIEETRNKLSFLDDYQQNRNLSAIKEINTTGSILSDFSYSRSEDDLNDSLMNNGRTWKKHRPSGDEMAEPATKKRRSSTHKTVEIAKSETVRATTTLTVNQQGPITATSIIETVPSDQQALTPTTAPPADLVFQSWARNNSPAITDITPSNNNRGINQRGHNFQSKLVVLRDTCTVCEKRIGFRKQAWKCVDCKGTCHFECKEKLAVPCVPAVSTPNQRHNLGLISDFTPTIPPMVPAILIHCINEIELRGLEEIGIYRIPGAERDVKQLKEKFLRGRTVPQLNQTDIHTICGTVKDFLRSLTEPLLTYRLRREFVRIIDALPLNDLQIALCRLINELPQPNRDTLAYIIVHLQKVAKSKECKMNISNLAMIFGPTIVGYANDDPDPATLINEVGQQKRIMEFLLEIPSDYWLNFINLPTDNGNKENCGQFMKLQQTPSTDSLLRTTTTGGGATPTSFFTPNRKLLRKRQKHFPSPK